MQQLNEMCQPLDYATATRAQLIGEIAYWKDRAEKAVEKAECLADDLRLYEGWLSNPSLQGNIPRVLIGTHRAIAKSKQKGEQEKEGRMRVWRGDVARFAGCDEQAVSSNWKKLAENGLLEKETVSSVDDGKIEKAVFVDIPRQVFLNPAGVAVTTTRHGGARVASCRECGSTDLQKEIRFTCKCCGTVMGEKQVIMIEESTIEAEQIMAEENAATLEQEREEQSALHEAEHPQRDCMVCSYREGHPVRSWVWDLRKGMWVCAFQSDHDLPKVVSK